MERFLDAYLDIETTGLSWISSIITVVGIYLSHGPDGEFSQLVGSSVTRDNLLRVLRNVQKIYIYNGSRFDIPCIEVSLGVDSRTKFHHHDLMYDCWRNNLFGGLKAVERQLGIPRQLTGIGGRDAISLWWRYRYGKDQSALSLLLQYNQEDVINLRVLNEKLNGIGREIHRIS